jgi:hypothetical protein
MSDDRFTPTRLIHIANDEYEFVHLCDNRTGEYVALSHCWGTEQPFTLTKKTCGEHHRGISLDRLPKTFRDAITITRKFWIQYI